MEPKNVFFGVKSLFLSENYFEERIVLYKAKSFKLALEMGENDAKEYSRKNGKLISIIDAFELFESEDFPAALHGREVYSKVIYFDSGSSLFNEEVLQRLHFSSVDPETSPSRSITH